MGILKSKAFKAGSLDQYSDCAKSHKNYVTPCTITMVCAVRWDSWSYMLRIETVVYFNF